MKVIKDENDFMTYAMQHYKNPRLVSVGEFQDDLGRMCLIKKTLDRYQNQGNINVRLLLNHFIVINNVFDLGTVPILVYKFKDEQYMPVLKSIFLFFGWITEEDLPDIPRDTYWDRILRNL